ncbi:MAG: sensor histidine kinase [Kofleriaceae bacterium]
MHMLHEVLHAGRNDIMARWMVLVQGSIAPESMPTAELIDHLPGFVDEIIAALRADAGLSSLAQPPEDTATAAHHGEQRLRLGFSLDTVVREYGALRDAIVDVARRDGGTVTFDELQRVFECIITGIARAVSEYARQRDAELQRQHNEHVAFLAHELRNPLSTATVALEVLQATNKLERNLRPTQAAARALTRMKELVDHSLQMARTASGVELKRELTQTRDLLDEAELVAACEAEDKDIKLSIHVEQNAAVYVDRRLIRSALNNLVRNAVKYSHRGGVVEVRGRVEGLRAIVEIEDRCGGLEPGKVEEAFAPFVRLASDDNGFGLGLSIAKQAVDAHAGTIRVQNLPGKGCIFVLDLPITEPVTVH